MRMLVCGWPVSFKRQPGRSFCHDNDKCVTDVANVANIELKTGSILRSATTVIMMYSNSSTQAKISTAPNLNDFYPLISTLVKLIVSFPAKFYYAGSPTETKT